MARSIAKDHGDKRRAILRAAARTFAAHGFDGASMAQVAGAAGISKANIYHYWPSKEGLVFDLLDTYLSGLADMVAALDLDDQPSEALFTLTSEILLDYRGMDEIHQIQSECVARLPRKDQEVLKGHQRIIVSRMIDVLDAAAPSPFADRKCARATAMSVFGMLNWHYKWQPDAGDDARRDYARLVTDLTLGGLPVVSA